MPCDLRFWGVLAGLLVIAAPASADAIDGDWCSRDGKRLTIRGPQIVTPGRNRIEGNYGRHDFSYTTPANEPDAGKTVFMILLSEQVMHLRIGAQPSGADANDEWRRCQPSVS